MASGAPSEPAITGSTWTADAERYDRWFDQRWGRYASHVEHGAVLAAAGDLTGAAVADIGCGTGRLTTQLEARAATVVGVDITVCEFTADPALVVAELARVTRAPRPRHRRTGALRSDRVAVDRRLGTSAGAPRAHDRARLGRVQRHDHHAERHAMTDRQELATLEQLIGGS